MTVQTRSNRIYGIGFLCLCLGSFSIIPALALLKLINFFTNLFYYQRLSFDSMNPAANHLGVLAILSPMIGGLIVGLMARWGSPAIRGHGIPEAMGTILEQESRIPKRLIWLKPLSSAIAIGSGGPFGAEGPIIATGGALGSALGQWITVSPIERKILLAAGAAAGMTAIFGTPFAAVLLAIELLLFEFQAESFICVAFASCAAFFIRSFFFGSGPFLAVPALGSPKLLDEGIYIVLGLVIGLFSILITQAVYWIEDHFEKLPIHWMYWPVIGGLVVGIVGLFCPATLGVGYTNIAVLISNSLPLQTALFLIVMKFISWAMALGSGTSGGTLAPLLTLGSGIGCCFASLLLHIGITVDSSLCAVAGMAALFAGCSRATLASVIFAVEMTHQQSCLVPVLIACGVAHLISTQFMQHSIMTEKIARRGIKVPASYFPDSLLTKKPE